MTIVNRYPKASTQYILVGCYNVLRGIFKYERNHHQSVGFQPGMIRIIRKVSDWSLYVHHKDLCYCVAEGIMTQGRSKTKEATTTTMDSSAIVTVKEATAIEALVALSAGQEKEQTQDEVIPKRRRLMVKRNLMNGERFTLSKTLTNMTTESPPIPISISIPASIPISEPTPFPEEFQRSLKERVVWRIPAICNVKSILLQGSDCQGIMVKDGTSYKCLDLANMILYLQPHYWKLVVEYQEYTEILIKIVTNLNLVVDNLKSKFTSTVPSSFPTTQRLVLAPAPIPTPPVPAPVQTAPLAPSAPGSRQCKNTKSVIPRYFTIPDAKSELSQQVTSQSLSPEPVSTTLATRSSTLELIATLLPARQKQPSLKYPMMSQSQSPQVQAHAQPQVQAQLHNVNDYESLRNLQSETGSPLTQTVQSDLQNLSLSWPRPSISDTHRLNQEQLQARGMIVTSPVQGSNPLFTSNIPSTYLYDSLSKTPISYPTTITTTIPTQAQAQAKYAVLFIPSTIVGQAPFVTLVPNPLL
jgi:hypothetical protein